ncbi:HlyU family transcriptional regulator [soil metagenome]
MSFLKKLFGGRASAEAPPDTAKEIEHNGFTIRATPYKEGGQYQLAGVIAKEIGGTLREHKFVRADRFSMVDEAVEFALAKGRQIVDEQGDKLFGGSP